MRTLLIGAAAAATLLTAAPAVAQMYEGPSVRMHIEHNDWRDTRAPRERGEWRHRDDWRGHYGWSRRWRGDDCRDITVRRRLPDGTVVVRRMHRC